MAPDSHNYQIVKELDTRYAIALGFCADGDPDDVYDNVEDARLHDNVPNGVPVLTKGNLCAHTLCLPTGTVHKGSRLLRTFLALERSLCGAEVNPITPGTTIIGVPASAQSAPRRRKRIGWVRF